MSWVIRSWKGSRRALLLGIGVFAVALAIAASQAHALRVTLKRVVFDGGSRTEVITLINNSNEPETYRLGWRRMRMTPDRALVNVADDDPAPDLNPSEKFVRFSPRRVTVKPGQAQQVRLMVRYPRDLPDGEYRSHFWIHEEAAARDFDETLKPEGEKATAIKLEMLTGITMPVFVRKGKLEATATIEDLSAKLQDDKILISYKLTREGNKSLYGDMEYTCTGGAKELTLATIRGVGIYTEVDHRNMRLSVPAAEGGLQACPSLKVTFRDEDEEGKVLADATASIQR